MFHIGETLLYTNAGHTSYVRVEEIFLDDNAVLRSRVRTTTNDELIETMKESLRSPTAPDIGWIPTSVPEKKDAASMLSDEELAKISDPVTLTPLEEEFVALHERLWHLPFSVMFRLVKLVSCPQHFGSSKTRHLPVYLVFLGRLTESPGDSNEQKTEERHLFAARTSLKLVILLGLIN